MARAYSAHGGDRPSGLVDPPWSRQPDEDEVTWSEFQTYRDLGEARSIDEMARRTNRSIRNVQRQARKYHWEYRVWAWDRRVDEEIQTRVINDISEMRTRQAQHAKVLMQALLQPAVALLQRMQEDPNFMADLMAESPAGVMAFLERYARVWPHVANAERMALGVGDVSVHHVAVQQGADPVRDWRDEVDAMMEDEEAVRAATDVLRLIAGRTST